MTPEELELATARRAAPILARMLARIEAPRPAPKPAAEDEKAKAS